MFVVVQHTPHGPADCLRPRRALAARRGRSGGHACPPVPPQRGRQARHVPLGERLGRGRADLRGRDPRGGECQPLLRRRGEGGLRRGPKASRGISAPPVPARLTKCRLAGLSLRKPTSGRCTATGGGELGEDWVRRVTSMRLVLALDPSEPVALFLPGIGVVVVAVALPEAGLVGRRGARSRAATWRSSRSTCRGRRGGAGRRAPASSGSPSACVASTRAVARGTRAASSPCSPARRGRSRSRAVGFGVTSSASALQGTPSNVTSKRLQRVTQWMSCGHLDLRQLVELLPRERRARLLDLAPDAEVPGREVGVRDRAGVEHRPLVGEVLAGRQPRRVVAGVDDLLLRPRSEEGHAAYTSHDERRCPAGRARTSRVRGPGRRGLPPADGLNDVSQDGRARRCC